MVRKISFWVFACFSIVCFGYVSISLCVLYRPITIDEYDYTPDDVYWAESILLREYEYGLYELENWEYKSLLEYQMKPVYIYTERNLNGWAGEARPILRMVTIDKDVKGYSYCVTLTHELMHLQHFSANERFVCAKTFEFLYENEDEDLKQAGVRYGYAVLNNRYSGVYDITDWIINYLKEIENE